METNKKRIEILLNAYECQLLELFRLQMAESNGETIDKDMENYLRRQIDITKNNIINKLV